MQTEHQHRLFKTAFISEGQWLYQCGECAYYEMRTEIAALPAPATCESDRQIESPLELVTAA